MFQFINDILVQFNTCFNRVDTWSNFVCLVIGLIVRTDHRGISSVVSVLRMKPKRYYALLNFLHSPAYSLDKLYERLMDIVQKVLPIEEIEGLFILIGDHIKVAKEAFYMPCIQKWHQESQNGQKKEYIEGHCWGFIGALVCGIGRCVPLMGRIHESKVKTGGKSIIEQMLEMAGKIAKNRGKAGIMVLDAYFFTTSALREIERWVDEAGKCLVYMITRAKRNAVAYLSPPPPTGKKGRPRKYGEKLVLIELFESCADIFDKRTLRLYGKDTEIQYLCLDLLQRPTGQLLRYVLTLMDGKMLILVCTNLSLEAEQIIRLYARRFGIEHMFKELKHRLGAFAYHFWTRALPKRKRGEAAKVSKNTEQTKEDAAKVSEDTEQTEEEAAKVSEDTERAKKVAQTKTAIEVFVCLQCIAYTILTGLAVNQPSQIMDRFTGWLRTVRTQIPTVMVAKQVLSHDFLVFVRTLGHLPVFKKVIDDMRDEDCLYKTSDAA